jgi:hypothetical protein
MMNFLHAIYIVIILFFFACLGVKTKKDSQTKPKIGADIVYDTLYNDGKYTIFAQILEGDASILLWQKYGRTLGFSDTLPWYSFDRNALKVNNNLAAIELGCGSACRFVYVVSLDSSNIGLIFYYPIIIDLEKKFIVWKGDGDELVMIKNLDTQEELRISESYNKQKLPPTEVIKSAVIIEDRLVVTWELDNNRDTTKSFKLKN